MKSATRNGPAEHGDSVSTTVREIYGKIRRMTIGVTSGLWQVIGHLLLDGKIEARDAEHFSGLGFYARPKAGSNPEAVVIFLGEGASSPTVIACRDEDIRRAVVGDLGEDESAMFNSSTMIIVRASGVVQIKAPGGTPRRVAFHDELHALWNAYDSHTHVYTPGGGTPTTTAAPVPLAPEPEGAGLLETE